MIGTGTPRRRLAGLAATVATAALFGACTASAATITAFSQGLSPGATPDALVDGGDGNIWFVDTSAIGNITPAGRITEFPVTLGAGSALHEVVPGANGVHWFDIVDAGNAIGEVSAAGQVTTYPAGTHGLNTGAVPGEMTSGASGTVWFTDSNSADPSIGRITADGTITEFPYTDDPAPTFESITEGSDGNIWVTDRGNDPAIIKVTPSGQVTTYPATGMMRMPDGLTPGPDGQMWFTDEGSPSAIGHLPENGPAAESGDGLQTDARVDGITAGADGNVWFDDQYSGAPMIGRATPAGVVREFPLAGVPFGVTLGIDGNIWATQHEPEAIDRVTSSGTVTAFTDGLNGTSDLEESDIITGPDGNLWFVDEGNETIDRAAVQLAPTATTGAASAITAGSATVAGTANARGAATTVSVQYGTSPALGSTVAAGTLSSADATTPVSVDLSGLPAGTTISYRVVATNAYGTVTGATQTFTTTAAAITTPPSTMRTLTATAGNQRISLALPKPAVCTAKSAKLRPALSTTTLRTGTKSRFVSAAFYIDRGIRHVRTIRRRVKGHVKKIKTTTYRANSTVRRLPSTPSLALKGLKSGSHTLRVVVTFHQTVTRHGKRTTVSVTPTIRATFHVC